MIKRTLILALIIVIGAMGMTLGAQDDDTHGQGMPPIYAIQTVWYADPITVAPAQPTISWQHVPEATWYAIYLQTAAGEQILYEWISAEDADCVGDCLIYADSELMNALFNPWGLLNGDYEFWLASYVPDDPEVGEVITWTGGETGDPYTFTVDVAAPEIPIILADFPVAMPVVAFEYDPDTTLWVQLYVGGNGEQYIEWIDLQNNTGCGVATDSDNLACFLFGTENMPIYWEPGTYQVWAQAWGPWGFSSPDGTDSVASWQEADYGENPGLVFPEDAPGVPMTILAGNDFYPSLAIAWEPVPNATWHRVVLDDGNGIVYDEWHHNATLNCHLSVCGLLVDVPDNTTYGITISTWGPGGFSEAAAFVEFNFVSPW